MSLITLDIPDQSQMALKLSGDKLAEELRMVAAVKLYEMGRLASGAAAEMAGIPLPLFLARLADYGVDSFRLSDGDLGRETRLA